MAGKKKLFVQQCRILKEYTLNTECVRLVECDNKLFWHITSHGEVKICEEVEGVVIKK